MSVCVWMNEREIMIKIERKEYFFKFYLFIYYFFNRRKEEEKKLFSMI